MLIGLRDGGRGGVLVYIVAQTAHSGLSGLS